MMIEIALTKIVRPCKNETIRLVGRKQLHDPRGWGNAILKEGKLCKRLDFG